MIVVDASSVAKYILKEDNWVEVENHLRRDFTYSVDHMLKEVLNAIWKNTVVRGVSALDTAFARQKILYRIIDSGVIVVEPEAKYLNKAFSIAVDTGVTVYDALYIAQALEKKAVLLTSDKKQGEAAHRLHVEVLYVP